MIQQQLLLTKTVEYKSAGDLTVWAPISDVGVVSKLR